MLKYYCCIFLLTIIESTSNMHAFVTCHFLLNDSIDSFLLVLSSVFDICVLANMTLIPISYFNKSVRHYLGWINHLSIVAKMLFLVLCIVMELSDASQCTHEKTENEQVWDSPCVSVTTRKTRIGIEVTKTCRGDKACEMIEGCKNVTYDLFDSLGMDKETDYNYDQKDYDQAGYDYDQKDYDQADFGKAVYTSSNVYVETTASTLSSDIRTLGIVEFYIDLVLSNFIIFFVAITDVKKKFLSLTIFFFSKLSSASLAHE